MTAMTAVGSIMPSRILHGFDIAAETARNRQIVAANRARLTAKYGTLSDGDIGRIVRAEEALAECAKCQNAPCKRGLETGRQPVIAVVDGEAQIRWEQCAKERDYQRRTRAATRLKNAQIPARYVGKTLADYRVDEDNKAAVAYAKSALKTGRGAYLFGERGTGKTFLAAIIAQEYLAADKVAIFIKVPRLLDEFYSAIRAQGDEQGILQALYTADLVVLDDFGMEKATKYAGTTLCKILDARYDSNLATLITSNYPLEKVQSELDNATDGANFNGSRIVDRCREVCKPILLKGKSRRR